MTKHILLVTDELGLQQVTCEIFRKKGYSWAEVFSSAEAEDSFSRTHPDLLVVDLALPGGSASALVAELRGRDPDLQVVLVTAALETQQGLRRLMEDLSVDVILQRPIHGNELSAQLDRLLTADEGHSSSRIAVGEEYQSRFVQLQRKYRERLFDKLGLVQNGLVEAKAEKTLEALNPVRELVHRVHGTAGSYGYPEVSEAFRNLEHLLDSPEVTSTEWWGSVDSALEDCEKTTAETASGGNREAINVSHVVPETPNILVLDDDEEFREFVCRLGRGSLLNIVPAATADEAHAIADKMPLSAALVDIRLGGEEHAFSIVRSLRDRDELADLPIAFVTVHSEVENRLEAVNTGASLFLSKPVTEERLKGAINYLISLRAERHATVLIIDDDVEFADSVALILESAGLRVVRETDPMNALEALESARPEIVLLDLVMPGLSGFDVCRMIRTNPEWKSLPVLLMTSKLGVDVRVATFEAGADDYLAKPIVPRELLARIRLRLERESFLREHSRRDPVTGLLLRGPFVEELNRQLAAARRAKGKVAVVLLDLDRLKHINDTHGHHTGDRVLARLGSLLLRRLRTEDLRSRWGGDEFALGLAGLTADEAKTILERVAGEFQTTGLDQGSTAGRIRVTFSAGISSFPKDGTDLEALISRADECLYRVKARGGGGVEST